MTFSSSMAPSVACLAAVSPRWGAKRKLCHHRRMALTAETVKAKARELGADGVGIADAVLEPDGKITEQLCIGEPCSRCLYSCPPDAVLHWGLDKRRCATFAQEFGFSTILRVFSAFVGADGGRAKLETLAGHEWFGIWQGLLRVVGAFGDCPRCLAVCPVGDDYNRFLKEAQREIPEKTDAKVARARELLGIRRRGEPIRRIPSS